MRHAVPSLSQKQEKTSFQMALILLHPLLLLQNVKESYIFPASSLYVQHQPSHTASSRCLTPPPEDHIQPIQQLLERQSTSELTDPLRASPNPSASYEWITIYSVWQSLQICCRDHNVHVSTPRQCGMPVWDANPCTAWRNPPILTPLSNMRMKCMARLTCGDKTEL